eukprot:Seg1492.4 transcript_id=Seg1492.4/GoldUCD/mRNA.D3Y31 product="hypothetical protein" protein_id=Seg1492.4/GoldUCD/D3Y31
MKMEEISLRNEEPQKDNDNVFVASNSSIFRIKLFNILLGVCLIFLGVTLLTGIFLFFKLKKFSLSNHSLEDAILSVMYIIVAIWVIISGIVCANAAICTKSRAMNAINMTFACLTICASAVAIAFNAMTINRFSSCAGSYGKSYCDEASPIRRRYHVPVLAGFVLVTCVAISIVTLTSIQVSRLRRMQFDPLRFKEDLREQLGKNSSCCEKFEVFNAIVTSVLDNYAPIKKKSVRANDGPFMSMTKAFRKAIMNHSH